MYLTTCNPRRENRTFNHGLTVFDDLFAPFTGIAHGVSPKSHVLTVDIYEKDEKLFVVADLPGLEKEEIKVDVKGRLLTLGGERNSDKEITEEGRYRSERRYGRFERTFKLPFEVNEEQVSATYKDGVLTLAIEKPEEQKPKQITIN